MQNPSLSERYGPARRPFTLGRPRLWIIVALVLAIILAALFASSRARAVVSYKDVSSTVSEKDQVSADFTVTKHPSATVQCAVQALNMDKAIVGWKVVEIPPNSPEDSESTANGTTTSHRATLRTVSPGVAANVHSCWIKK